MGVRYKTPFKIARTSDMSCLYNPLTHLRPTNFVKWKFIQRTQKISGKYLHSLPRYRNFKFIGFLTVQHYFPSNSFYFTGSSLDPDNLKAIGIFAISQLVLELYAKDDLFLFLQRFNSLQTFLYLKICKNIFKKIFKLFFFWKAEIQGFLPMFIWMIWW